MSGSIRSGLLWEEKLVEIPRFVRVGKHVFATDKIVGVEFEKGSNNYKSFVIVSFSAAVTDAGVGRLIITKEEGKELVKVLGPHVIRVEED